jgi:hypothetical protein
MQDDKKDWMKEVGAKLLRCLLSALEVCTDEYSVEHKVLKGLLCTAMKYEAVNEVYPLHNETATAARSKFTSF